jgi:hypothetical protein
MYALRPLPLCLMGLALRAAAPRRPRVAVCLIGELRSFADPAVRHSFERYVVGQLREGGFAPTVVAVVPHRAHEGAVVRQLLSEAGVDIAVPYLYSDARLWNWTRAELGWGRGTGPDSFPQPSVVNYWRGKQECWRQVRGAEERGGASGDHIGRYRGAIFSVVGANAIIET